VALFEPVHGSAPPLAGKDIANPFAALLTVGMLLTYLGWPDEEGRIERIVAQAIEEGACTVDVGGTLGTRAASTWVRERVAKEL
jgi:3-isopropylmalate dehydrogenase